MSDLLKPGGPYKVQREGSDQYRMSINLPLDDDGMLARECPSELCSPAYFKVKPGTGITGKQEESFCPYCAQKDSPNNFATKGQVDYAKKIATREVMNGVEDIIKNTLGLGATGEKTYGGGFLSLKVSYKPGAKTPIWQPREEVLRRDLICPNCTLAHAVFGMATWCPDCGADIFLTHMVNEYQVIEKVLLDVDSRKERLGSRAAARDIENALEDTVTIFEACLKATTRRHYRETLSIEAADDALQKRIANRYQSITLGAEVAQREFGSSPFDILNEGELSALRSIFEKRHPITHNLGIVDRKYLERVASQEAEGRDIHVTVDEVLGAINVCIKVMNDFYPRVFPSAVKLKTNP